MASVIASPALRTVGEVLGVALAYTILGKLAVLIALPPVFSSAVWPAAGVALALTLVLGGRALAGVGLGSVLVNADFASGPSYVSAFGPVLLALGIAVGHVGQAAIGAWLVRRFVGYPCALDEVGSIARFFLLGGLLACLVASTWGTGLLVATGAIMWADALFNWWTWWMGDCIGVVIFAPLTLIALGEPRDTWRRRRGVVGWPLLVAVLTVTVVFVRANQAEQQRAVTDFERRAEPLAGALQRQIDTYVDNVDALARLFESSENVTRTEFTTFVQRPLALNAPIAAFSWHPRVKLDQLEAYQAAAAADGVTFELTERSAAGDLVPAGRRSEYAPAYYMEPFRGNEAAFGYDVSTDPIRAGTLVRAAERGGAVVTSRLEFVQDRPD